MQNCVSSNFDFSFLDDEQHYDSDPGRNKPILTDELSDISDEDFGDINVNNNSIRTKKVKLSTYIKVFFLICVFRKRSVYAPQTLE